MRADRFFSSILFTYPSRSWNVGTTIVGHISTSDSYNPGVRVRSRPPMLLGRPLRARSVSVVVHTHPRKLSLLFAPPPLLLPCAYCVCEETRLAGGKRKDSPYTRMLRGYLWPFLSAPVYVRLAYDLSNLLFTLRFLYDFERGATWAVILLGRSALSPTPLFFAYPPLLSNSRDMTRHLCRKPAHRGNGTDYSLLSSSSSFSLSSLKASS